MPILNYQYHAKGQDGDGNEVQINPSDFLAQRGPLVQITISQLEQHQKVLAEAGDDIPAPVAGFALIDTGASVTCIDVASAQQAGLAISGTGSMNSATHANEQVPLFAGRLDIAGLDPNIAIWRALGANLREMHNGIIALIGRDVLKGTVLIYNGLTGTVSLSL